MAPGPVTTVVIGKGSESPHVGALVAIGHGIVEFPLMIAVFFGVGQRLDLPYVQSAIAIAGGAFLLLMGVGMLRSIQYMGERPDNSSASPLVAGILMSIGNPYFFIWWATIGAALILRSVEYGLLGFVAFAVAHWLCDFVWDYFLWAVSYKRGQFFGRQFQKGVFILCGVLLLFFGARLAIDGLSVFFV
jgi:threonine/homoserine/homoserine lactone efflux protein